MQLKSVHALNLIKDVCVEFLCLTSINESKFNIILLFKQKLGSLVSQQDLDDGRVYPPVPAIHDVTVKIAAHLAEHLYQNKKAWNYPGKNFKFSFFYLKLYFMKYLEPKNKE